MARYYRRFIDGFSKLAKPMIALLEKNAKFVWSKQCQDSFEELKKRLTFAPVLILPKASLSIVMPHGKVLVLFLCKRVELLPTHLDN